MYYLRRPKDLGESGEYAFRAAGIIIPPWWLFCNDLCDGFGCHLYAFGCYAFDADFFNRCKDLLMDLLAFGRLILKKNVFGGFLLK